MSNIKNFGIVGVGNDVQFGKNGSRVVMNGSAFHFRNAQDSDFVDIKAKNLVVSGDLTVQGGTTELQTEIIKVEDKNIQLGVLSAGSATDVTAAGGGITLMGTTEKTILWDAAGGGEWKSSESVDLAAGKAYRINGVDVLSSTTLGGAVVNSSLTSVGTLVGLNVGGNVTVSGTVTAFAAAESGKTVKVGANGELVAEAGNVFGNITISGNTISSTNTNGPIILDPNGSGEVQVSGAKITGVADGVIATDAATVGQMTTAIAVETTRATAAEAALQTSVTALQATDATHTSQIAGLTTSLANEVTRATAAEAALQTSVTALQTTVGTHTTQIAGLTTDLAAEVTRATAAEAALQTSVTAIQTTVATHTTQIAGLTTDLAAEVTRATAAEDALDARVDLLEAKKTKLNVVGLGLSYVEGTETLTLASTPSQAASTIVARDAFGASAFQSIYIKGLTAQKLMFADSNGLVKSAANVSLSTDGTALTVGSVTISGTQISVAGGTLDVNGAVIANVAAPVASTDAVNKDYVDTAIAAVTIPNLAHAVYKAFGTAAETLVGSVTGFVHRIKVYVGSAYDAGATVTVGITGATSDLVANTDLDAEAAGIYTVEIGKLYATPTDIKVFVAGSAAGAGTVVVEYL
jgi:predicted  nucleic acid-binding Zn-ribbon protein